jgi:hypothetical protein
MPDYGYTLSSHDPERPWLVVSIEHRPSRSTKGVDFRQWARDNYSEPRWRVEADPWQFGKSLWRR